MLLGKHGVAPETPEVPVYDPKSLIVLSDSQVMNAIDISNKINALESIQSRMSQMNVKVENLRETLGELLDNDEIESDVAEKIADIFGITIDKTVDVLVTVEFNLTINLPRTEDLDDVVNNISFSAESYYRDNAEIESEDYHIVDWSEDK
jgi:hypothetical protein